MQLEITDDIKNLKALEQGFILDTEYWLSFNCNKNTINSIVNKLGLTKDENQSSGHLQSYPPKWWDEKIISTSTQYSRFISSETKYMFLWYNESQQKAFYQQWWN